MLKTHLRPLAVALGAYHLGEGRVLKTLSFMRCSMDSAYHLGEGRVLKTDNVVYPAMVKAYHLGEGRVLKTRTA